MFCRTEFTSDKVCDYTLLDVIGCTASEDRVQHRTVLAVKVWVPRASKEAKRMLGKRIGSGRRHVRRRLTDL